MSENETNEYKWMESYLQETPFGTILETAVNLRRHSIFQPTEWPHPNNTSHSEQGFPRHKKTTNMKMDLFQKKQSKADNFFEA